MKLLGSLFHQRSLVAAKTVRAATPARPYGLADAAPAPATGRPPIGTSMFPNFLIPAAQARWLGAGISFYTPQLVEYIYRQALSGDLQSQWEMFDLMESTWPELSECENELKDAVCNMADPGSTGTVRFEIKPFCAFGADPTPEAERRAAVVQECLYGMRPNADADENDFTGTVRDIMDARFKGLAVLEIDWEMRPVSTGPACAPRATRWVHPSWYGYPFGPGNERIFLKLGGIRPDNQAKISPSGQALPDFNRGRLSLGGDLPPIQSPQNFYSATDFTPFPQNKFIIAVSKNKSGHPLGGALLHILAWYWAAMNFSLEWFLNFAQIFGQPLRWANYDPNLSDQDQAKLQSILQNMGTAAWAMFPEGVTMELKEAAMNAQGNPQMAIIQMANTVARKLILRQTLTGDIGQGSAGQGGAAGSRSLGEVHERILDEVKISCGKWAARQLQQLIRAICVLNFGSDDECPTLALKVEDENEAADLGELLVNINSSGLQPTDDALDGLSDRLGVEVERKAAPPADAPDPSSPSNALDDAPVFDPSKDIVAQRHLWLESLKKNNDITAQSSDGGSFVTINGHAVFIPDSTLAKTPKTATIGEPNDRPIPTHPSPDGETPGQSAPHPARSGRAPGPLASAASHTGGGAEASPGHDATFTERKQRIAAERSRLKDWAEENDKIVDKDYRRDTGGGEHSVQLPKGRDGNLPGHETGTQRVIKTTLTIPTERNSGYGLAWGTAGATPSEYLDRLQTQNRIFNDDVKLVGVKHNGAIVTSQPWIKGPDASQEQIDKMMAEKGFNSIFEGAYHHPGEGIVVSDMLPKNVKVSERTGRVVPLDPVIQRVTPKFVDDLKIRARAAGVHTLNAARSDPTLQNSNTPFESTIQSAIPRLAAAFTGRRSAILGILHASDSAAEFQTKLLTYLKDPAEAKRVLAQLDETLQLCAARGAAGAAKDG